MKLLNLFYETRQRYPLEDHFSLSYASITTSMNPIFIVIAGIVIPSVIIVPIILDNFAFPASTVASSILVGMWALWILSAATMQLAGEGSEEAAGAMCLDFMILYSMFIWFTESCELWYLAVMIIPSIFMWSASLGESGDIKKWVPLIIATCVRSQSCTTDHDFAVRSFM